LSLPEVWVKIQKVLLIDDDPDVRRIGTMSLRKLGGFNVLLASSGPEGIEIAKSMRPDVILLDIVMPDPDGWSTLARLKQSAATYSIPVIFITGRHVPPNVHECERAGAIGVIVKPFDPLKLPSDVCALVSEYHRTARSAPCAT
jgi:two-component system, OmpR family, response regulator